jgi:hypothetical protein
MVVHTYKLTTWETEAGESKFQGQSGLYSEFKANLSYPYLKKPRAQLVTQ